MDIVTKNLLAGFSKEFELTNLNESDQFERLAAFSMIRRHYSRSFDIEEVAMGGGGDTGIDAMAVIVNNVLVTDVDTVNELAEQNGHLDVSFIFIQAERSSGFDGSKIGDFGFGVRDFFAAQPQIKRNDEIAGAAAIVEAVYARSAILARRPVCVLYYVTTGKWQDDNDLSARRDQVVSDLASLQMFSAVRFHCMGADELLNAYQQTKNAVTRTFEFKNKNDLPATDGVVQAFIGYIPFSQFITLISDESGEEILGSIFDDNVRDWQDYNQVNQGMKDTLNSPDKARFVLMNNGVTIIARSIMPVGSKFTISDYQIVNGCQTSNVLFDQRAVLDDTVCVPLRLIETRDEGIMDAIIAATNNQTQVKAEQYFARMKFSRKLEAYFSAVDEQHRIHYERRDGQYDRGSETKTKVVSATTAIRSFGAVYLEEPHRTTRGYTGLRARVGTDVFAPNHTLEPYYASSYAHYLLETRFRVKTTPATYKPARFHILLALRLLVDPDKPSWMNSHDMKRRAIAFAEALYDPQNADQLFNQAVALVDTATGNNLERDHVRTIGVTNNILRSFGRQVTS